MSPAVRMVIPVRASASGRLGVTSVATGSRRSRSTASAFSMQQRLAMLADHHRVDHQGEPERRSHPGNRLHHGSRPQRAGLGGRRRHILKQRGDLLGHQIGRQHFNPRNPQTVLHREQCNDGLAVDPELMKGFQIRLDTRSATGIRPGNRKGDRRNSAPPALSLDAKSRHSLFQFTTRTCRDMGAIWQSEPSRRRDSRAASSTGSLNGPSSSWSPSLRICLGWQGGPTATRERGQGGESRNLPLFQPHGEGRRSRASNRQDHRDCACGRQRGSRRRRDHL